MENIKELNTAIIAEFRQNDGKIGGQFAGGDFLILHTTGARSGTERLSPMAYLPRDGRFYVFAVGLGDVGAATHPAWYHNLVANPDVTIEVGSRMIPVTAAVLRGDERREIWEAMISHNSHFATYRNNRDREIPAIALSPKLAGSGSRLPQSQTSLHDHEEPVKMNDQHSLITQVEREVLSWPGVSKEFRPSSIGDATIYWLGERQLGHIHADGVADLQFPKAVHDELIAAGRAKPHRGGFAAVVSYTMRGPEDVPRAIELFRLSYDRVAAAIEAQAQRRGAA